MKYKFMFQLKEPLKLRIQYNHVLQSALMSWLLHKDYGVFIHDRGYQEQKRKYKLYTFSKIFGNFIINKEEKTITFYDKIHIYLSSIDSKYFEYVINNVLVDRPLNLKGQLLMLTEVMQIHEANDGVCRVKTVSPITMHSTMFDLSGNKKTYYHNPYEQSFADLLKNNLIHKYVSYYDKEPDNCTVKIAPQLKGLKESIVLYKGIIIKGWNGIFQLEGSKELIDIALTTGLGSRSSQGFGMVLKI